MRPEDKYIRRTPCTVVCVLLADSMCVTWASHDSIGSCRHWRKSCFKGTKPRFLCGRDANRFVCGSLMMRRWHETGQSLVRFKLLQPAVRLMCGQSELWQSVGMRRSTKADHSTVQDALLTFSTCHCIPLALSLPLK